MEQFITEEMGLVRSDGGAKWTEGITELIVLGMNSWREGQYSRSRMIEPERVEKLEEKNERLREKVESLQSTAVENDQGTEIDAVRRVQEIEASILKVLCVEGMGSESPNCMPVTDVCGHLDFDMKTVVEYAEKLSRTEYGGYVRHHSRKQHIKATSSDAFEDYCEGARIDTEGIDV
jgi:hypothetical protein